MQLIDRDASDKYKGFRFQKLRLAKKMLELLKANPKTNIIGVPEYRDDSYFVELDGNQILEQDKEYGSNFTFNGTAVRVSIVNFLDNYLDLDKDPNVHFVFHTNVDYGKERKSGLLETLNLTPLEKPILEYLVNHDFRDEVIEFVSKVIIQTYKDEYRITEKKSTHNNGFYKDILKLTSNDWKIFLKQVTFQFGQGDLDKVSLELLEEIKMSNRYKLEHVNKEEQIRSHLLEKIDERMSEIHLTQKIISSDTVKNVFLEIGARESNLQIDELYKYWIQVHEELGELQRSRNLREKIFSVCGEFDEKTMTRYNREATTVRDEMKRYDSRQINALRFRVYESMERYFDDGFIYKESFTYEELNHSIKELKARVIRDIDVLRQDYDYGIKNNLTVEKITLLLIDECFYSFNKE